MDADAELLGDDPARPPRRRCDPEPEVLDAAPRELWRPPVWVLLVATLAVAVSAVAWHADQRARARESSAFAACRMQLHGATTSSDLQLMAVAHNLRPALSAARRGRRDHLAAVMSNPAQLLLPDVVTADRTCRAVAVLPWHFSQKARRDAATAYSAALTAKVRAIAADGRTYYQDEPSLRRLRRAAEIGVFGGRY